jgi:hypothetical protein
LKDNSVDRKEEPKKAKYGRSMSNTDWAFAISKGLGLGTNKKEKKTLVNEAAPLTKIGKSKWTDELSAWITPINHYAAKKKLEKFSLQKDKMNPLEIIQKLPKRLAKIPEVKKMRKTQRPSVPD